MNMKTILNNLMDHVCDTPKGPPVLARVLAECPINSGYNEYWIRIAGTSNTKRIKLNPQEGHGFDVDFIKPGDMLSITLGEYRAIVHENKTLVEEVQLLRSQFIEQHRSQHAKADNESVYMLVRTVIFNHELREPAFLLVNDDTLRSAYLKDNIVSLASKPGDVLVCKPKHGAELVLLNNISFNHQDNLLQKEEQNYINTMDSLGI